MSQEPLKPVVIAVPDEAPARSKGKTIAIVAALVVMVAGLSYLAFLLFAGDENTAATDPNEVTPESAVKGWYDALAKNQPQVLWAALPQADHEKAARGFQWIGEQVGEDRELYERGLEVAGNFAKVMFNKKKLFVGLIAYHDKKKANGGGGLAGALGAVTSLADAYKGGGANGPDLGKLKDAIGGIAADQIDPAGMLGGVMKDNDVKPWKFDATYGLMRAVLDGKIKDVDWLNEPNMNEFVADTGVEVMTHLDKLEDPEAKASWSDGFKTPINQIKVTRISWKEDGDPNTATVKVECPPIPFLEISDPGFVELKLALVDGRWRITEGKEIFFGRLIDGTEMTVKKVEGMAMFQIAKSQMASLTKGEKDGILDVLDTMDDYLIKIDQLQSPEELAAMGRKALVEPIMGHVGGIVSAANGNDDPVKPAVTEPNGGLTGTIPGNNPGLKAKWIYGSELPPRVRLDNRAYLGKSKDFIKRLFGVPQVIPASVATDPPNTPPAIRAEEYLVYQGVIDVLDGRPGRNQVPLTSVAFGFQRGVLVKILVQ